MIKSLIVLLALLAPTTAAAHVSVPPSEAPANGYTKLSFRVPHGCQGSPSYQSHGKTITETVSEVIWSEGSLPDNLTTS